MKGCPSHRHGITKQDTVFACVDEIDRWVRQRTRQAGSAATTCDFPAPTVPQTLLYFGRGLAAANAYLAEHDAITRTIDRYIAGGGQGTAT